MAEPIQMRMNDANALKLLRDIAKDSGNVVFLDHVRKQMKQRRITTSQILTCLQYGTASEPVAFDQHGNWKLTVGRLVAGTRLEVAVAIELPRRAIVITAYRS